MIVIELVKKDIKLLLRDKKVTMVIILMPIIIMSILGVSLQGMFTGDDSGIQQFQIGVVKAYDLEAEQTLFFEEMGEQLGLPVGQETVGFDPEALFFEGFLEQVGSFMAYSLMDEATARQKLQDDEIRGYIVLEENFIYNSYHNMIMPENKPTSILVGKATEGSFSGRILEAIVHTYFQELNKVTANKSTVFQMFNDAYGFEAALMHMGMVLREQETLRYTIEETSVVKGKRFDSFQYYAAAIMSMFLFYGASITSRKLLAEKQAFTLMRQLVSNIPMRVILIGNFFTTVMIAIIQSTIMVLYSSVILGVNWGSLVSVGVVILLTAFAIGGLGSTVAILTFYSNNYLVANFYEFAIINFMALVGGSFLPIAILPEFIQKMSNFSINGLAIKLYTGIMLDQSLMDLSQYVGILLAMGGIMIVVTGVISMTRKEVI